MMSDSESGARRAKAEQIEDLLHRADAQSGVWRTEELAALLRHQLAAPVAVDLGSLSPAVAQSLKSLSGAQGLLIRSFADVLYHPHPPLDLLGLLKDFAKAAAAVTAGPIPRDVAQVLYYAAIASGLRAGRSEITSLDEQALREGFAWVHAQRWVDPEVQELLTAALAVRYPPSRDPEPPTPQRA
jgi:hypothetical protein